MRSRAPGWLGVALAASLGGLAGVLATIALGGGRSAHVETITVPARADEETGLVSKAQVPPLMGLPLSDARDRLHRVGFLVEVDGADLRDLLLPGGRWAVATQYPAPGTVKATGSTVRLTLRRR